MPDMFRKVSIAIIVIYIAMFIGSEYLVPVRKVWYYFLDANPGIFVLLGVVAVIGVIVTQGSGGGAHKS
jgi:hypothetical protein